MAHDIPKVFLENSHFENTTASFPLRCQNLLRTVVGLLLEVGREAFCEENSNINSEILNGYIQMT